MELMGDSRFSVAVPISADVELKRRIMGAIKSYYHGTTVDRVIKKFGAHWTFPEPNGDQLFVAKTLKCIARLVEQFIHAIERGDPRPEHSGLLAAEVALVRLQPTFRSALILVSQAYAFEAAAVVRLILEQVAWAYAVHLHEDEKTVSGVSTTGSITSLKRDLPYVGSVYGYLSKRAHVDPTLTFTYFRASTDGVVEIKQQMSEVSFVVLGHLLAVLAAFERVTLITLGKYVRLPAEPGFRRTGLTTRGYLNEAMRRLILDHTDLGFLQDALFPEG
jgi:hypothetical protein